MISHPLALSPVLAQLLKSSMAEAKCLQLQGHHRGTPSNRKRCFSKGSWASGREFVEPSVKQAHGEGIPPGCWIVGLGHMAYRVRKPHISHIFSQFSRHPRQLGGTLGLGDSFCDQQSAAQYNRCPITEA